MIKCSCYECGTEVPEGAQNHFVAFDGRILCKKCSEGVEPLNDEMMAILIKYEESENV